MTQQQTSFLEDCSITRAGARAAAMTLARQRREAGISKAARRAERLNAGWCGMALEHLRRFACSQVGVWTIEQVRAVLESQLPAPTDARAWGRVCVDAIRLGYIEKAPGVFLPAASSNAAPKQGWRRGKGARAAA